MITAETGPILLIVLLSYLIGSLPTAYLIARTRNINIFEVGSGNMGGTNIARSMGLTWGLVTAGIDVAKGIVAVLLAQMIMPDNKWVATTVAAVSVISGHNWSLFATIIYTTAMKGKLTIRGGKGAATAFGTILMVAPVQTILGMLALGGALILMTRYVSLAVLAAFAVAIMWLCILVAQGQLPAEYVPYSLLMGLLIGWRFRENIQRLANGTERRLGEQV